MAVFQQLNGGDYDAAYQQARRMSAAEKERALQSPVAQAALEVSELSSQLASLTYRLDRAKLALASALEDRAAAKGGLL